MIPRKKGANMGLSIYALKLGDKISREEYDNTGNGWYVYQAHGMEPIYLRLRKAAIKLMFYIPTVIFFIQNILFSEI